MLLRETRTKDSLGLVYGAPFPYILTQDLIDAMPAKKFMTVVLPISLDGNLPHQAHIPTDVQRSVAPDYIAAILYRAFHPDSKAAYDDLDKQLASATRDYDLLDLKTQTPIAEITVEALASVAPTLDALALTATLTAAAAPPAKGV